MPLAPAPRHHPREVPPAPNGLEMGKSRTVLGAPSKAMASTRHQGVPKTGCERGTRKCHRNIGVTSRPQLPVAVPRVASPRGPGHSTHGWPRSGAGGVRAGLPPRGEHSRHCWGAGSRVWGVLGAAARSGRRGKRGPGCQRGKDPWVHLTPGLGRVTRGGGGQRAAPSSPGLGMGAKRPVPAEQLGVGRGSRSPLE